jgi:hypothetical protein
MPFVKFTSPNGQPVWIDIDQIARVLHSEEARGSHAAILIAGTTQSVSETVDEVMALINKHSGAISGS